MKVTLINPQQVKDLFVNWGKASAVCYDTTTNSPGSIGIGCMYSHHFSGSRGDYIKFLVTGVPRFTIDQAVRHEVGVFKNVQSFRYVNKESFAYEVPSDIVDNPELLEEYDNYMMSAASMYEKIQNYVLSKGSKPERANEQARYVLPMSTHSSFIVGFTVEALIHFCNERLCTRAEDVIRKLATGMRDETLKVLPELKSRLVPSCQMLLWCPEAKKSCGAYPTRGALVNIIKEKTNEC